MQDYLNLQHQVKIIKTEYNRIVRMTAIVSFIAGMIFSAWLHEWLYHAQ